MRKLAALGPRTVELTLPAPFDKDEAGNDITWPIYTMTWPEWEDSVADIVNVKAEDVPKIRVVTADGIKLEEDRVGIARAQGQIEQKRILRRVAYALQKTGEYEDLNGASLDEAVEIVRQIDAAALWAISQWLAGHVNRSMARVVARAEMFRGEPGAGARGTHPAGDGVDAGTVG